MKQVILCLVLAGICYKTQAQKNSFHADMMSMNAIGGFKNSLDGQAIGGLSVGYTRALKKGSKWELGLNLGVGMYAYRKYDATFIPKGSTDPKTTEVYEDDCLTQVNAETRYTFFKTTAFQPYAIGRIGRNNFFSHIDPTDKNAGYETQFKWQGHAMNVGFGIGTRINLNRLFGAKNPKYPIIIDISKTVNFGTQTTYRYFKNNEAPQENLNYGLHNTTTSYTTWNIGIGIMW